MSQQAQPRPVIKPTMSAAPSQPIQSRPQAPTQIVQQVSRAAPTAMTANPLQSRQSVAPPAVASSSVSATQPPRATPQASTSAPRPSAAPVAAPVPAPTTPAAAPTTALVAANTASNTQYVQTPILFNNIHYRRFSIKARDTADNIAILKDKPILLDYWIPSLEKRAFIGLTKTNDKHLIISKYDYTSKIEHVSNVSNTNDMIVETANSIYIVAKGIECRRYEIPEEYYDDDADNDHKDG